MSEILIEARNICKSYAQGDEALPILKSLSLSIRRGESLSIVGPSGAGKSTLLHILGTLDRPDSGELFFAGQDLLQKNDEELAQFRNSKMGFVFQFHHLLPEFTALENVMLPCRIGGESKEESLEKAKILLQKLALSQRENHYPNQLSGGELQRVAVARALIRQPQILFADEPTGNLDSKNSQTLQQLFLQLQRQEGLTLVVVTHDLPFAQQFGRKLNLSDGHWSS